MHIALFGGAFDPPHFGHAMVVHALLADGEFNQVWCVCSGTRQDKRTILPASERVKLLNEFVSELFELDKVQVSDIEVRKPEIEGTVELIRGLREEHPTVEFSFVIGADLISQLPTWRHVEALKREVRFVLVERPGSTVSALPPDFSFKRVESTFRTDLSSSAIKAQVEQGIIPWGVTLKSVLEKYSKLISKASFLPKNTVRNVNMT